MWHRFLGWRLAAAAVALGLLWAWHSVPGAEASKERSQGGYSVKDLGDAVHVFSSDEGLNNADVSTLNKAVSVLENQYGLVVEHCLKTLHANVGKAPKEMIPSKLAVRSSIRQLAHLSGYCRQHALYSQAANAVIPFVAEEFDLVRALGGPEPTDRLHTEGSRALPTFGVFGARAIADWISQGKAGKNFDPTQKDLSYLPFLLAKTLEETLGDSDMTLEFLKLRVGPRPDPDLPLARFCEFYRKLYEFPKKQE